MASGLGMDGLVQIRVDSVVDCPDFRPRSAWLLSVPRLSGLRIFGNRLGILTTVALAPFLLMNCIS